MIKLVALTYLCLSASDRVHAALDGRLTQLIFPPGSVFTMSIALSVGVPEATGIVQVFELDIIYPTVPKGSDVKDEDGDGFRGHQRRVLREQMEEAVNRLGYDGRGCVRRFQCELNGIRDPQTALEDLLLVVFSDVRLDCRHFVRMCPFSLLQIILHSVRVNDVAGV